MISGGSIQSKRPRPWSYRCQLGHSGGNDIPVTFVVLVVIPRLDPCPFGLRLWVRYPSRSVPTFPGYPVLVSELGW